MDCSRIQPEDPPQNEKIVSFVKDVQLMMFGLGDVSCPLVETAEVIEKIVLRQMSIAVTRALTITHMRGQDVIGPEDLLFLMRKDLDGLKRLIEYLGIKDERQMFNKTIQVVSEPEKALDAATAAAEAADPPANGGGAAASDENSAANTENPSDNDAAITGAPGSSSQSGRCGLTESLLMFLSDEYIPSVSWDKNRKQYCLEFLKSIGIDESDIESADDSIKLERQMRANHTSLKLTPSAYESFHAARRASFGASQMTPKRFENWLKVRGDIIYELKPPVIEILVYLAKETIAQLIDRVFILRAEKMDRFQMNQPPAISVDEVREVIERSMMTTTIPLSMFSRDVPNIAETRLLLL